MFTFLRIFTYGAILGGVLYDNYKQRQVIAAQNKLIEDSQKLLKHELQPLNETLVDENR
jgi:hypothetical protein